MHAKMQIRNHAVITPNQGGVHYAVKVAGGGEGALPVGQALLRPWGNPVPCVSRLSRWNTLSDSYTCQHMGTSPCSRQSRLD